MRDAWEKIGCKTTRPWYQLCLSSKQSLWKLNILCPFTLPLWSFQIHDKINDRHQIMVEESWIVGEGNGNPLQYSCLENPMDRGAWWATVHRVAKSRTRLSDFTCSLSWTVGLSFTKEVTILINLSFSCIPSPALLQLNSSAEIRQISSWCFFCFSLTFTCFCIYSYTEIIFPFLSSKEKKLSHARNQ